MTLAAVVAPLAAYAVVFQTLLYLSVPARLRTRVVPLVTGVVGATIAITAGMVFGYERVGLKGGEVTTALAWGVATMLAMSLLGVALMSRGDTRIQLADRRLADLSPREAIGQIFIRIPVFTALIEEAFFRGVLHAALMALYPIEVAIWLGAGLFGLWHIGPGVDQARADERSPRQSAAQTALTVVATTVAGAFLVWLRIETGSIWAPVAVHAGTNMTMALFARAVTRTSPTPRSAS